MLLVMVRVTRRVHDADDKPIVVLRMRVVQPAQSQPLLYGSVIIGRWCASVPRVIADLQKLNAY